MLLVLCPGRRDELTPIMSASTPTKIGTLPAVALVVASMVGTGVFTSLGYQVGDIPSGPGIVLVWALGGLVALCGALSYAELAGALPRSGGEYHFIGKLYHPSLGWTAGLLSAVVGFAAPTALAALALGSYAHRAFPGIPAAVAAVVALVAVTGGHLITLKASARLQTVATGAEAHAGAGVHPRGVFQDRARRHPLGNPAAGGLGNHCAIRLSRWRCCLFFTLTPAGTRRFTCWRKSRTRGGRCRARWCGGTLLVMGLYVLLNAAFLKAAPVADLAGVTEVGHVAARGALRRGRGAVVQRTAFARAGGDGERAGLGRAAGAGCDGAGFPRVADPGGEKPARHSGGGDVDSIRAGVGLRADREFQPIADLHPVRADLVRVPHGVRDFHRAAQAGGGGGVPLSAVSAAAAGFPGDDRVCDGPLAGGGARADAGGNGDCAPRVVVLLSAAPSAFHPL